MKSQQIFETRMGTNKSRLASRVSRHPKPPRDDRSYLISQL